MDFSGASKLARSKSTYQKSFQQPFSPNPDDVIIAVMGMTGAGKSTFISHCTDDTVAISEMGALESCTQEVQVHKVQGLRGYNNVYLVDTPGFDDTNRKDSDILKEISSWMSETYQDEIKIRGILYLHRISDNRMGGCARKNLIVFKKLCGHQAIENVVFTTTFWEKVDEQTGGTRESTLQSKDEFWGFFCQRGAKVARHWNNKESALAVISRFVPGLAEMPPEKVKLLIQSELVDSGKDLIETTAGQELKGKWQKEREALLQEMRENRQMMKEAHDEETRQILREEQKKQNEELRRRDQQVEELKTNMERMHEEKTRVLEAQLRQQSQQQEMQRQQQEAQRQAMERMKQEHREESMKQAAMLDVLQQQISQLTQSNQERASRDNRGSANAAAYADLNPGPNVAGGSYRPGPATGRTRETTKPASKQRGNMWDGLQRQFNKLSPFDLNDNGRNSPRQTSRDRAWPAFPAAYPNPAPAQAPRAPATNRSGHCPNVAATSGFPSSPRKKATAAASAPGASYRTNAKGHDARTTCLVCGKRFNNDRDALYEHIEKARHAMDPLTHRREAYTRPVASRERSTRQACMACGKDFVSRNELFRHLEESGHARDLTTGAREVLNRGSHYS